MLLRRRQDPAGLNLEDTRLTDPRKLGLLVAILVLAIAWAGATAARLLGRRALPTRKHRFRPPPTTELAPSPTPLDIWDAIHPAKPQR